jgi:hypothetical protein
MALSWMALIGLAVLAVPAGDAQEEGEAPGKGTVRTVMLEDGVKMVSVGDGPPALIDSKSGMVLKLVDGQPALVDTKAGEMIMLNENGEPVLIDYKRGGWKKSAGGGGAPARTYTGPELLERMKELRRQLDTMRKEGGAKKTRVETPATRDARLAAYRDLLGFGDAEWGAVEPLLRAVLVKQDEVRRSRVSVDRLRKGTKGTGVPKDDGLPPAIRVFHRKLQGGADVASGEMKRLLDAFRAARAQQDAELKRLRDKLREVLTVRQEALLAATGVLD